jgi:hypothetical protein
MAPNLAAFFLIDKLNISFIGDSLFSGPLSSLRNAQNLLLAAFSPKKGPGVFQNFETTCSNDSTSLEDVRSLIMMASGYSHPARKFLTYNPSQPRIPIVPMDKYNVCFRHNNNTKLKVKSSRKNTPPGARGGGRSRRSCQHRGGADGYVSWWTHWGFELTRTQELVANQSAQAFVHDKKRQYHYQKHFFKSLLGEIVKDTESMRFIYASAFLMFLYYVYTYGRNAILRMTSDIGIFNAKDEKEIRKIRAKYYEIKDNLFSKLDDKYDLDDIARVILKVNPDVNALVFFTPFGFLRDLQDIILAYSIYGVEGV